MSTLIQIEITAIHCIICGVYFGIEEEHRKRLLETKENFYCPGGHTQHYISKTRVEQLQEELNAKSSELTRARTETLALKMKCESVEKEFIRHRRRASAGTCPCCQRTFSNMARHMKTKHPEFKA